MYSAVSFIAKPLFLCVFGTAIQLIRLLVNYSQHLWFYPIIFIIKRAFFHKPIYVKD